MNEPSALPTAPPRRRALRRVAPVALLVLAAAAAFEVGRALLAMEAAGVVAEPDSRRLRRRSRKAIPAA